MLLRMAPTIIRWMPSTRSSDVSKVPASGRVGVDPVAGDAPPAGRRAGARRRRRRRRPRPGRSGSRCRCRRGCQSSVSPARRGAEHDLAPVLGARRVHQPVGAQHLGRAQRHRLAGRADGPEARHPGVVLAEVDDEHAGRGLGDLDRPATVSCDPDRRGRLADEHAAGPVEHARRPPAAGGEAGSVPAGRGEPRVDVLAAPDGREHRRAGAGRPVAVGRDDGLGPVRVLDGQVGRWPETGRWSPSTWRSGSRRAGRRAGSGRARRRARSRARWRPAGRARSRRRCCTSTRSAGSVHPGPSTSSPTRRPLIDSA